MESCRSSAASQANLPSHADLGTNCSVTIGLFRATPAGCPCRVSGAGRRSLLVVIALTLLLLYYTISPPTAWDWQPAARTQRPRDVVIVTGSRADGEPVFCVRQLSATATGHLTGRPAAATGRPAAASPDSPQMTFLPGVKNPCWLEEIVEEDSKYLGNTKSQLIEKAGLIKLRKRAELYATFAGRRRACAVLRVRCLPFVYLIGQPKCGTTDLRDRLRRHPQVASGLQSGGMLGAGHWWSRTRYPPPSPDADIQWYNIGFHQYLDSFELVTHRLVGGDCSGAGDGRHRPWTPSSQTITVDAGVSTMWDGASHREALSSPAVADTLRPPLAESVAAGIAELQPGARIVAILREPADRLFSDYLFFDASRDAEKSSAEFHQMSLRAVEVWTNCTESRTDRDCSTDRAVVNQLKVRLHVGLYAVHLRSWLEAFGRHQVLVLRTEDYKRNITESLDALFQHLGLESPPESLWEELRSASPRNVRRKSQNHQTMLPETRQLLRDFYRPYNRRLAKMLRSDRFLWEDVCEL